MYVANSHGFWHDRRYKIVHVYVLCNNPVLCWVSMYLLFIFCKEYIFLVWKNFDSNTSLRIFVTNYFFRREHILKPPSRGGFTEHLFIIWFYYLPLITSRSWKNKKSHSSNVNRNHIKISIWFLKCLMCMVKFARNWLWKEVPTSKYCFFTEDTVWKYWFYPFILTSTKY